MNAAPDHRLSLTANDILDVLIAGSDDFIWASELAFASGMRRIDFFTLAPIASRGFRTSAYEIKISRADFKRDTETKQAEALKWSDRFWYVTPPGLLSLDEVPDWAGLQECDGLRLRIKRKAPMRRKADPDWLFVVSLLRNSGDCRRDVALLKTQVSHLQSALDHRKRLQDLNSKARFQRWLEKNGGAVQ